MFEQNSETELWTYRQVAERLKCCVKTVREKLVKPGLLKAVRCGKRIVRFRPCDVEELIRRLGGDAAGGIA